MKRSPVYLRGVRAAVLTLGLLLAACGDVTEPSVRAPTPTFSHSAYGNDFFQYPWGVLLHDHGWTRIQRWWPWEVPPILGVWRIRDTVSGALAGRAVQLESPPVDVWDVRAIRWDTLSASLGPPLDILAHFWIPPLTKRPKVGVAWFMQDPDETGQLRSFALVRNMLDADDGFNVVRYYNNNTSTGIWMGTKKDGLKNSWVWLRVQHTMSGDSGTIRFRAWKGTRANEPSQWAWELTSSWFGPSGGLAGPLSSGRAGLLASGDPKMAGTPLYWDMLAVSNDIAPCEGTVTTIISEYQTFAVRLQPTCGDFAAAGGSTHFLWDELNDGFTDGNPHPPWGMIRQTLLNGLEATRTNYNRGGILLTSGYRCPHGNRDVGGVPQSYHMHGVAADMYSADHGGRNWTEEEFNLLKAAAEATVPSPRESFPWAQYTDHHYHAAW